MSELTLYTNTISRGNTVELFLRMLDVPYQRVEVNYGAEMHTPAYLAINPMAKVPALTDGDAVVTETAAICLYLADKFIEKGFAPALNSPERAVYYRWILFTAGPVESAFTAHELGLTLNEEQQKSSGFGSYARVMDCLKTGLTAAAPYLCGSQLTAADVYVGAFLFFLKEHQLLESGDIFDNYLATLAAHPQFNAALPKK